MVIATTFSLFNAKIPRWRLEAAAFLLALDRVNTVAVTTMLVLHVGVIGHHVACHDDFMLAVIRDLL